MTTSFKPLVKLFTFLLLIDPCIGISQPQNLTCSDLKNGIFYSYPKNSADHYVMNRDGEQETEINITAGDTTIWKTTWLSECTYRQQYVEGGKKMIPEVKAFVLAHTFVTEIENITAGFFTYKMYVDKIAGKAITEDTVWFNEKINVANNTLFEQIPNNTLLKKIHFTDTSSYAILYIYRVAKVAGKNGEYLLYFDNNLMCASKNGCAYTFKIYKGGTFELSAKLFNQKDIKERIEIKPGQKYYLKAGLKFVGTTGSGWRPDFVVVDEEKGSEEFFEAQ